MGQFDTVSPEEFQVIEKIHDRPRRTENGIIDKDSTLYVVQHIPTKRYFRHGYQTRSNAEFVMRNLCKTWRGEADLENNYVHQLESVQRVYRDVEK